jgi:hypothetical protein
MRRLIWARDHAGRWHITLGNYPSSTDTACGVRNLPVFNFQTTVPHDHPHPACRACLEKM